MKPFGLKIKFVALAVGVSAAIAAIVLTLQWVDYFSDRRLIDSLMQTAPQLQQAQDAIRSQLAFELWVTVGVCLLLGAGIITAAWFTADHFSNPIRDLIDSARKIGGGNYSHPLEITRKDELAELQRAINQMRENLQQTTITTNYLNSVLNSMHDAVLVTDATGAITKINQAALRLLNYNESELIGQPFSQLLAPAERETFSLEAYTADARHEVTMETAAGQIIPVSISGSALSSPDNSVTGAIFVARDITERKRAERRIRYLARYDALTKVPNRMQFQHMVQQAISRTRRSERSLALLYLDLDRFKEINDTFGHNAGDRTLETFSERLSRVLPKEAVVGRLAGDEFALFIECANDEEDRAQIAILARMVLAEISKAFYVQQHEVFLTASIGISICPKDAENVIDLIRNADAAMYHSKQNGGNNFAFYSPDMNAAAVERLMLKSKLRRALEHGEFEVVYQPKVDLRDGRIIGSEALLRWRLPGHGDIPPSQFIPLAEETNLILDIGDWVLNRVCADYKLWHMQIGDPGRVSINLSLKQLRQSTFTTRCKTIFKRHEVSPAFFELEITETTLMNDTKRTLRMLDELYAMGLHLSIDDFGTGYSSLSALQQFPISTLKIDQSFVRDIPGDTNDATIARTIVDMGRSMGMEVIAEGVETREQMDFLRAHGCHYAQGRLFGDPVSADSFLSMIIAQNMGASNVTRLFV
jgi:diguanylate cyclase (GGDEF)-like protein/PAS domain S-box-containing protein